MGNMIKHLHIHNYKCLVNFDLELQDISLLLGGNGVGKTAVMDVLFGLRELLAGRAKVNDSVAFQPNTLTSWSNQDHQLFKIQVHAAEEVFDYKHLIEHKAKSKSLQPKIAEEILTCRGTTLFGFLQGQVQLCRDDGSPGPKYKASPTESALARVVEHADNPRLTAFKNAILDTVICAITPNLLSAESSIEDMGDAHMTRYAENFVTWYSNAMLESPTSINSHIESLREIISGLDTLSLRPTGLDTRALFVHFNKDMNNDFYKDYRLRLDKLSTGQSALVVLYALLYLHIGAGGVLFLDEPDNFVMLAELQPWLMALEDIFDDEQSQIVIASHHPELINYLGPESGIILSVNSAGYITAKTVDSVYIDKIEEGSKGIKGLRLSELVARGWE